jgi:DNA processing protein
MNFPKRNRIISGLSLGIVAVEAKEASGVMNTVNWALNQGRDVFAVPGSIFSKYSLGTNALIKAGAAMAVSAQDVLEELKLVKKQQRSESIELALGEEETAIMALLSERPVYLDEIAVRLSRPVPAILNTLLTMELKGVIRQLPGKTFVRGFG